MFAQEDADFFIDSIAPPTQLRRIAIGVTHPQTCLILSSRLRALRQAGFEVTLICSPGERLTQTALSAGVRIAPVSMKRTIDLWEDIKSLFALYRELRRIRPDIAEFSTPKAGLLGSIAAWLARVPNRVYLLRGLKLETTAGFKRHLLKWMERIACWCAQTVLVNSESLRLEVLSLKLTDEIKLHLIGDGSSTGVDIHHFQPGPSKMRKELGIPEDAKIIGFVGRITRDKGVPQLVQAFKQVLEQIPSAYLLLVGWFDASEDAVDRALIEEIATHARIRATGLVIDTAPYYRIMDLMALPTLREGFPNAILEAAATGLPVISTLTTGAKDAVLSEVTGLLVEPGYPEALTEAIVNLLNDPERRQRMGRAARVWIHEHFSTDKVLRENVAFYQKLSGAKAAVAARAPDKIATLTSEWS